MSHNFETQRRDTYASFKNTQGVKLPKEAVVEFLFFIEELDANWKALEKARQAAGFRTKRLEDGVVGPGFEVEVFNVLGAGDAFMSGFLRGWLRDLPLERCWPCR